MRGAGSELFTIKEFSIPFDSSEHITLWPLGDIHRDAPSHALEAWRSTLRKIAATPRSYIVGMGDYLDFCSTKERKLIGAGLHTASYATLDEMMIERMDGLIDEIRKTRATVIGLIEGNHHWTLSSGETTTQYLARLLGAEYMGAMSLLCLTFRRGRTTFSYNIAAHHGTGGGKRAGASINRIEDMSGGVFVDAYLMGHDHQTNFFKAAMGAPVRHNGLMTLKNRPKLYISTGSYQLSFVPGMPTYPVKGAMKPTSVGSPRLTFFREHTRADDRLEVEVTA